MHGKAGGEIPHELDEKDVWGKMSCKTLHPVDIVEVVSSESGTDSLIVVVALEN